MKWSIIVLVIAGVVASLCAALLVASIRADTRAPRDPSAPDEVSIVVAAEDLAAISVVETRHAVRKTVPEEEAPEGSLSDPVQVVGKILTVPMVAGQAFTERCFATEGTGVHLASALPKGMRAVSVSLSSHGGLDGILYPGSVVDILVSFKVPSTDSTRSDVISRTLLQGVHVLAVEDRTVTSGEGSSDPGLSKRFKRLMITLMLDSVQAEAVQLATEHGSISLAMRNPLDSTLVNRSPTALSELSREWTSPLYSPVNVTVPALKNAVSDRTVRAESQPAAQASVRQWETIIIRGAVLEKCLLPVPADLDVSQTNEIQ